MARVLFNNVVKRYNKSGPVSVDHFNLEIEDKEFMVLVGPSGCGKSTTLRMVAGLEQINGGEIYIGNQLVNDIPPKKRDIAMVFQNYALYPNMSIFENMAFGLRLRKVEKHLIESSVKSTSRALEIEHLLERKPMQLSGGQRQRVALGRAVLRTPQVFLMDEPLSNLDAKLRVQMREMIIELHRELETTMIYVTHDQTEAMTMGTRICVMKDGIIMQVDTPELLYNRPVNRFVASFIGSPEMNFLQGTIIEKDGIIYFDTNRYTIEVPKPMYTLLRPYLDRIVTLGIRPEYVHIVNEMEGVSQEETPITGTITFSELMGADRYIHLDLGHGEKLVIRVPAFVKFPDKTKLEVSLNMEYMIFFNRDSGLAIR
ncbi:ABC transporter ATP-binding protein [Paenibacillus mendelii]|uniref:ABC transporter ATP-binding protein n=1 Tax=Paenibacillus mendelii TaxID=206163 RepID=A0ABV6JNN5_9BACL|nr:sn-glycerol-3-phosphate ABC transporter ATP-binding protein UgpC [Paenibacillus mendelii]MCQ6559094.1 sn-glycerol-3-phosphate ABC transporter ATP-binding protein UgpC [Paenibacillus mendelii]